MLEALILLVEDDEVDREMVHRALGKAFEIVDAIDVPSATAALAAHRFDCAIIDVSLPGQSGLTLLPTLKEQDVPGIILTSAGSEVVAVEALKAGASDYLPKGSLDDDAIGIAVDRARERAEARKAAARASEALRQKSLDLERHNAELEAFTSAAAHDLAGPLRRIGFYIDRIRTRFGDDIEEETEEDIERIGRSAGQLANLIRDLLALAKISSGEAPRTELPLDEPLEQALAILESEILASEAIIDRSPLPSIDGNRTQLQQLFTNLIGNALKFAKEDVPPHVTISAETRGDRVRVTVTDQGRGFRSDMGDRLFEPFIRGTSSEPGSGIGLSICRRVVESHGGQIQCTGAPDQGATFRFEIPVLAP